MIPDLPFYINLFFILTTLFSVWLFYKASNRSIVWTSIVLAWLAIQAIITLTGFYTITNSIPPRFMLLIAPPFITIGFLFITSRGRSQINKFDTKWLTYLHIVRIPVEVVLLWLFINKLVPEIMTFEGRNFDILSGITAPFIAYFGYQLNRINKLFLLIWNLICLLLLINIVSTAILSVPFPFQKLAFDQPNVGVLYFPFTWLPCFIVPAVLLSHLICIKQLLHTK